MDDKKVVQLKIKTCKCCGGFGGIAKGSKNCNACVKMLRDGAENFAGLSVWIYEQTLTATLKALPEASLADRRKVASAVQKLVWKLAHDQTGDMMVSVLQAYLNHGGFVELEPELGESEDEASQVVELPRPTSGLLGPDGSPLMISSAMTQGRND